MIDQVLEDMKSLLRRLSYDPERMRRNLHLTNDVVTAEALMNALILRGLTRERAYEISQSASRISLAEGIPFWEAACKINEVRELLNCAELKDILNPENYIGVADKLVQEALRFTEEKLKMC
jgi:adenylosuccinate lyase